MSTGLPFWIGFHVAVILLLALDLFVFHRKARAVTMREAGAWSLGWVALSMGFAAFIYHVKGPSSGLDFVTGYVIEYSLSVDNLFVFVLLFAYFQVEPRYQHRVLLWGILGALAMRGALIGLGVEIVSQFRWVLYLFGAFLLFTGVQMFREEEHKDPGRNPVIRLGRKWLRVTPEFHGDRFFVLEAGRWLLTPLALTLVVIDVMDLLFAVDSIPAVFAVTTDPFIVYTSNICAILGLRSLYFLLAGLADRFKYLRFGLAAVLVFVGAKMLLGGVLHIPGMVSLAVVAVLLAVSIACSLLL